MSWSGWVQVALYVGALLAITKPLGLYMVRVLDAGGRTFLDPALSPVERLIYRLCRVDAQKEQDWKQYSIAMLVFSLVTWFLTYGVQRLQAYLPLNPQGLAAPSAHLSFNTATSFTTNTNWQSYGGEATLSYLSQMVGLTFQNFVSAAVGIAVAAALVRGIARNSARTIGNFWTDLVRLNLYLLLPICLVFSLFLVSQGMIQNFSPYTQAKAVEQVAGQTEAAQAIAQGPMASQVAIKQLGTNGGGFLNVNSAHPYENPTPLSNFVEMFAILAISSALTYTLGRMVKDQRHGWAVWGAMFAMFMVGFLVCWNAEVGGNPHVAAMGVDPAGGNVEGKEVRFGVVNSALWCTATTAASNGSVNSMHDSYTPLGGLVPLFFMQTGEVIFGGVGAGLYGMLIFVVLAIFIAGLMVGRTPEYLGKKIEAYDVKVSALAVLVTAFSVLGFTAWAVVSRWGVSSLNNAGPHGLSEILYAFSSATGNNGSAFAGLNANTPWYNTTLGLAMFFGRFFVIIPALALAGSLARKKLIPPSPGSFPVSGATFIALLIGTVVIVGALTFFPALALGPIVEHFLMHGSMQVF